jgi:hypothetical protein
MTTGSKMREYDPFPIEKLPLRIKQAVLNEFEGRCPTVLEVASTPDSHWLTVPNMGPTSLGQLRSATKGMRRKVGIPTLSEVQDSELLLRTRQLEKQFQCLRNELKTHRAELQMRGISLPFYYSRSNDQ